MYVHEQLFLFLMQKGTCGGQVRKCRSLEGENQHHRSPTSDPRRDIWGLSLSSGRRPEWGVGLPLRVSAPQLWLWQLRPVWETGGQARGEENRGSVFVV